MNWTELIEIADDAIEADEACVLCTVVRLDGSGYARPGARLLLTESGQRVGYISGGCLEKELCRRVWSATEHGPRLIAFDTRVNSRDINRFETGCEGVVYVFCQRMTTENKFTLNALRSVYEQDNKATLITIYRSESPLYSIGSSWLCDSQGLRSNVSSSLPFDMEDAVASAKSNRWILFADSTGREMEAAIEVIDPPQKLTVFGAGDDVIPVVSSAIMLGWKVTVIGHRPELAASYRFPGATVHCGESQSLGDRIEIDATTDVLVMTHDFTRDVELLVALLKSSARSIGLLGPKRRLGRLIAKLFERGTTLVDSDIARLRSPIGLDIGSNSPAAIAISIIAELIAMQQQSSLARPDFQIAGVATHREPIGGRLHSGGSSYGCLPDLLAGAMH